MTKMLHEVAEHDTPEQVKVPESWNALIVWAIGRFGGIIVATALCAYALQHVYLDMQSTNLRILVLMEQRAVSDSKLADALNKLGETVTDIRREAEAAHRPK